jgi:CheY-like chemotaxis protein
MPDLNGLEVYKLLKLNRITYAIPIIFFTAMVSMKKTSRLCEVHLGYVWGKGKG